MGRSLYLPQEEFFCLLISARRKLRRAYNILLP